MAKTTEKAQGKAWVCPDLPCGYKYSTLTAMVKSNSVPKAWNDLYDGILKMIKEDFKKNPNKTFFSKEMQIPWSIGRGYYKDGKEAPYSPAIVLNDYLTKRLKKEGYKHASIRIIYIPSKGSRWAQGINAMRQREYEAAYTDWQIQKYRYDTQERNEILGGISSPGKAPEAPTMVSSYVESRYVIMVQCSKIKSSSAKKMWKETLRLQRRSTKSKIPGSLLVFLAYILPVAALAGIAVLAGLIGGMVNPEFEMEVLFAVASAPIVIGGLLIGWGFHSWLDKEGYL